MLYDPDVVNLAGELPTSNPFEEFTLARESKEAGIAVNAIGPGLITMQSNIESMKPTPEDLRAKWVSLEQISMRPSPWSHSQETG